MKRTFFVTVMAVALISPAAFAYSEIEETRNQHEWFEAERMRSDGSTAPRHERLDRARPERTCPSASERRRDADFQRQLQLTDGFRDPAVLSGNMYASGSTGTSGDRRQDLAMNCPGRLGA